MIHVRKDQEKMELLTYRWRNFWRCGYWWVFAGTLRLVQALHLQQRAAESSTGHPRDTWQEQKATTGVQLQQMPTTRGRAAPMTR